MSLVTTAVGSATEQVLSCLPEAPGRAAARVDGLGRSEVDADARKLGLRPLLAHYLPGRFAVTKGEALPLRFQFSKILRATRTALELLGKGGVDALALKGVGLGARLYPEAWLRPTSDVDVLVRPQQLEAATALLRQAGYHEFQGPPESVFDFYHHCSFVGPGNNLIEIHFTPACGFQSRFDVDQIFERAAEVAVEGTPVRVMGLSDALVHQCVHAAHHHFDGVKWLFDIKLLVGAQRVDWPTVVALAREAHVAAATGMALCEAVRRVRAPVPQTARDALAPPTLQRLVARAAAGTPHAGVYPLSLVLADSLTTRWAKELAARPIERLARLTGREREFRGLVRRVLGIEPRQ